MSDYNEHIDKAEYNAHLDRKSPDASELCMFAYLACLSLTSFAISGSRFF